MKLSIITGNRPHMLYMCKMLSEKYEIQNIFFFKTNSEQKKSTLYPIKNLLKKIKSRGLFHHICTEAAYSRIKQFGHPLSIGYSESDKAYSKFTLENTEIRGDFYHFDNINSSRSISIIKKTNPDILLCHGGPIYIKQLIETAPLVLNYHSGISPIYNGAHSHLFALANGHPQFVGGTLMKINEKVDGGDILAHYFPDLTENETPLSLFIKNMQGSFELYDSFLSHHFENKNFAKIKQNIPLFYFMEKDWGFNYLSKLKNNIAPSYLKKFCRKKEIVEYYRSRNDDDANNLLTSTLNQRLFGS